MPDEKQTAIALLDSFDQKFTTLIELVSESTLVGDAKANARELLGDLKEGLKAESRKYEKNRANLNQVDKCYVRPALNESCANLKISKGSKPTPAWVATLSNARYSLKYYLDQLRRSK